MTDKEKIKAEIERRMKGNCPIVCSYIIYEDILKFIDSLPEEPVSSSIEAELDNYIKNNFITIGKSDLYAIGKDDMLAMIKHFIPKEEPVSDDLEEAANKFAVSDSPHFTDERVYEILIEEKKRVFKAGAQWQKRQGLIEQAEINYWNQRGLSIRLEDKCLENLGFEEGDKVRIIIIKEG